jgi:hypothetical protein
MSGGDYSERQRARNADYSRAYADWVAKLGPRERRKLRKQGLLSAEPDRYETGKPCDVSELPLVGDDDVAIDGDDEADAADPALTMVNPTQSPDYDRVWEVLRRLLGELLSTPNAQLSLECLALVSGVGFMGDSMTAIAKRHGVTRAAVSKRCIQLTEQLDMLPSRAMRSLTARATYRTAQTKHYELRERFDHRQRNCPRD